jgi:hypothetical protein
MASTRNKNTPGNYCLEQREFKHSEHYTLYKNSQYGEAVHTNWAGDGLLGGQIPWNKLSYNAADTESFLFGINSTNLVNPAPVFVPEIAQLQTVNVYNKGPTYIPQPLVVETNQRPYPVPN